MTIEEILNQATLEITNGEYKNFDVIQDIAGITVGHHVINAIYERAMLIIARDEFDSGVKAGLLFASGGERPNNLYGQYLEKLIFGL